MCGWIVAVHVAGVGQCCRCGRVVVWQYILHMLQMLQVWPWVDCGVAGVGGVWCGSVAAVGGLW